MRPLTVETQKRVLFAVGSAFAPLLLVLSAIRSPARLEGDNQRESEPRGKPSDRCRDGPF